MTAPRDDSRLAEVRAGAPARWHDLETAQALAALGSDAAVGLAPEQAERRLAEYGENVIQRGETVSWLALLAAQFRSVPVYLLLGAAALSLGVGLLPGREPQYTEALLIVVLVLANAGFGFFQDFRAERAMEALRELSTPEATVIRGGERTRLPATRLVPGDVILLEEGDRVPADARVLAAQSLETVEAALTGESGKLAKESTPVPEDISLAERTSMVFMNTDVVRGRGKALVVATGMRSEVGAIAREIQRPDARHTPFQDEVDRLGRRLGFAAGLVIVVVAAATWWLTAAGPVTTLMLAITLAVAVVPEGLPAIVTLALAIGARKLSTQRALVRRLAVVESLGSIDVIVTDKTGTLTENRMTVRRLWFAGAVYEVAQAGDGMELRRDGEPVEPARVAPLLRCGAIANDAELGGADGRGPSGDPTEVALRVVAERLGVRPEVERLHEVAFSSERKRMTVVVAGEPRRAFMKGAPETLLQRCNRVLVDGEARPLDEATRAELTRSIEAFAEDALRVLACSYKEVAEHELADEAALESNHVFLGLQGMLDPPRPEVRAAVEDCRAAGIRVIMLTGDNAVTARAIAAQLGFESARAATGKDVDALPDAALADLLAATDVFARVSPSHKLKLLRTLQAQGHRVAMTGDGVNDAPALRHADVGVAMGQRGTDVAKEAADMVLQDDDFVTLRDAIAQGRGTFDNIQKFVAFLLSANVGEVLIVLVGVILGSALFPDAFAGQPEALVLTPVMLLWVNVVTDGLPALALGVDPRVPGIMKRRPRPRGRGVLDRRVAAYAVGIGVALTAAGLPVFFTTLGAGHGLARAQTQLFSLLVLGELTVLQVIRAGFGQRALSNLWLLAAVAVSLALQLAVLYTPLAQAFGLVRLDGAAWTPVLLALAALVAVTAVLGQLIEGARGPAAPAARETAARPGQTTGPEVERARV
ncbi:cation-translocating P-type ATPase [Nannocystis pusilla]|uniref:Cation-transporting P-type ATPase n=1 Tax=Nannocystis pusilla TaxID=889268 RepID=A0ABS7U5A5_9BACT|nr:cation-transporting P-type ATPase [Nannocystis pusilla]